MGFLNILGFLLILSCASLRFKRQIQELIPFSFSIIILVLYYLACFRKLSYINWIFIISILVSILYLLYSFWKRNFSVSDVRSFILSPGALIASVVIIFVVFTLWDRTYFSYFDEFNFWGLNVKSLWVRDGLIGSDRHVAINYSDYPPGISVFQWWFLNFKGGLEYQLVYIATYIFNFSFLFPILSAVKTKKFYLYPLFALFIITVVSIVNVTAYCSPLSPDGTTGFAFGYILYLLLKDHEQKNVFDYMQIAIIASALVLLKSTAIFLLFILAIIVLTDICFVIKEYSLKKGEKKLIRYFTLNIFCITTPLLFYYSWKLFCDIAGLSNYLGKALSSNVFSLLNGTWLPPIEEISKFIYNMLASFFISPGFIYDINYAYAPNSSISMFFLCATLLTIAALLTWSGYNSKKVLILISFFIFIFVIQLFGVFFFVFWGEFRYYSISQFVPPFYRYGSPMIIGVFLFILYNIIFPLDLKKVSVLEYINTKINPAKRNLIWVSAAVIFCMIADIPRCYVELITSNINNAERSELYQNQTILEQFSQISENPSDIKIMCWGEDWRGPNMSSVLEMIPATVYNEWNFTQTETIENLIRSKAYTHIFWDGTDGGAPGTQSFGQSMMDNPYEIFQPNCVYRIVYTSGAYKLEMAYAPPA